MDEEVAGEAEGREKGHGNGRAGDGLKVSLCMLLVQAFQTGMAVLSKLALDQGMFVFPFLFYRNAIGAISVACFAFLLDRNQMRKLGWRGFMWIFLNAFFGLTLAMSLFYYGLRDTTAAYSSIFLNLIPVVTFIFSVCLRVERLGLCSVPGVAKVIGTLVCVGGAMIISLYKGKVLHIWPFHIDITHNYGIKAPTSNLPRGTTFLVGSTISYACWFILQVKLLKAFPSIYWSTAYSCAVGCVQSLIIGLSLNRERSAWLVVTRLQLVTIIYSALLNTAATFVLVAWAVSKRGPTFPPIFSSISLIFITIVESLIMGLQITVGSLLGMFLITVGIYGFLWGKAKEIAGRNRSPPRSVGAGDVAIVSRLAQTQSSVIPDPASSPAIENTDEPPV